MEYCPSLSDSLPNLDSLPQHCGVLSWLLGDSDSAYFNKNMSHFLAIQTCICMQGIELASAVGQWCWASCTGWALMKFKCLQWCSELKRVDVTLIVFWRVSTCRNGWAPFTLSCFNSCTHRQQECLRPAHCCVNLLSIALLVENGALKNFTQKCVKINYS